MTSRETAFAALLRVEDGAYSNVLLPTMLRDSALDAPRPSLRHGSRVRHPPATARARLPRRVGGRSTRRGTRPADPRRTAARCVPADPERARPRGRGRDRRRRAPPGPRLRERGVARAGAAWARSGRGRAARMPEHWPYGCRTPTGSSKSSLPSTAPPTRGPVSKSRTNLLRLRCGSTPDAPLWKRWRTSCAPRGVEVRRGALADGALLAAGSAIRRGFLSSPKGGPRRRTRPARPSSASSILSPARRSSTSPPRPGASRPQSPSEWGSTGGSSRVICIPGASAWSPRRGTGSGSIGSSRSSPTAGRCPSDLRAATGLWSTRRAAAWASCAAAPSCGGASGRTISRGSSSSSATCCAAQPKRSDRAVSSSIRCAR